MPLNSFKYADENDLRDVFNDYYKFIQLTTLTGDFNQGATSGGYTKWTYYAIADPIKVYASGVALSKESSISAVNQFTYSGGDLVISLANGDTPKDDVTIEIGKDRATAITDALVLASDELNSKIDNKYPRPLPKTRVTHSTDLEYEAIVKRVTCLLCAKNLIKARDPLSEEALAYDQEAQDIIDGMNNGSIKLVWENDATEIGYFQADSSNTGTIVLEQVMGNWSGRAYDLIEVEALGSGGLGDIEVSVKFGNSDAIGNDGGTAYTYKPSGSFDYIGSGLMIRFSQADASGAFVSGDKWTIPVKNTEYGNINSNVKSVKAVRNR